MVTGRDHLRMVAGEVSQRCLESGERARPTEGINQRLAHGLWRWLAAAILLKTAMNRKARQVSLHFLLDGVARIVIKVPGLRCAGLQSLLCVLNESVFTIGVEFTEMALDPKQLLK